MNLKNIEKTLDKVLIVVFLTVIAFIVTMIVIFCIKDAVPDSLVTGVLGLAGGECGFSAVITAAKKIVKNKEEKEGEEDESVG